MAYHVSPNTRPSTWPLSLGVLRSLRAFAVAALFVPLATCGDSTAPDPTATKLAIETALSNVTAGTPITLKVVLADDQGTSVLNATGTVTVAIASGTGSSGATLNGSLTATATQGEVTFTGLSINKAGVGYKLVVTAQGLTSATSPAFDVNAGPPSQVAITAGNGQNATAGAVVGTAPSVLVKDAFDNAASGVAVTFAVATGGGSITGGTATTDANGAAAVGSWTLGKTVGANTLTATVTGITPVTISATGTAGAASQLAINGGDTQTAVAGVAVTTAPSVIVKDANNNVVSGASVTFAVASGGGTVTGGTQATNASGIATVGGWTLGTTMGANSLTASISNVAPVTISATGIAGAATQIAINAGSSQSATAGSAVSTAPSVIVKDANNNAVAGVSVTFAVASGGGTLTGGTQITNASGVATVGSWTLGTTAGANTLTATSGALSGSPLTFSATGNAGVATQIAINAGNSQTAVAGAAVAIAPSVIARDVNNNVVAGVSVTFSVASGGGSIIGASQTTDANGVATIGSWTLGTSAGANSLAATSSGLSGSPITLSATGIAGAATQIALNAGDAQTAVAGAALTTAPSVIAKDANNNVVAGVSVTFAVATGGGSITGASQTTDASGVATVGSWTLGTNAGANSLTAVSTGLTNSPITFNATGVAGAATQMAINAGNAQTATAGAALASAPSVIVRDANNNAVAGVSVTFAVASGGGSATGVLQTTNANGVATIGSWTLGTAMGANSLTAISSGLSGSPITFSATGVAGAATQIGLSAGDVQTGVAGAALPTVPSVIVKDANNNVVAGVSITFVVASGGGSVTGASQTTDANGVATVGSWTLGSTVGANSLTATSTGLAGSPVTFTATGVSGSANQIALNLGDAQSATVATAVSSAPSVIVKDANGNVVSGVSVTFAIATGGGSVTGESATTDANGVATLGSWTLGTTAGANSITATSTGLIGSPVTINATGTPGAATQIAVNAGGLQEVEAGSAVPIPPSVKVADAYGNGVGGVAVTFAVTQGTSTLVGGSVNTGADGIAAVTSWTLGTETNNHTLQATATGLTGSPVMFNAAGVDGPATQIVPFFDGQNAVVGTAASTLPFVIVKDQHGNTVSGVSVTFAVTSGGGSITGTTQVSNGDGVAKVDSWTVGTTAGLNTISATAPGLTGSPVTLTMHGLAGAAAQIAIHDGDGQAGTVALLLETPIRVIAKDTYGNPVDGNVTVAWAVASGGGSVLNSTSSANSSGIAAMYWTLGTTAGANTVTATVDGLTGSPLTFIATGTPGAAAALSKVSGDGQTATAGDWVPLMPVVKVVDTYGNPVGGVRVALNTNGVSTVSPDTLTTEADGTASFSWALSQAATANVLGAKVVGNNALAVTFNAQAVPGPVAYMEATGGNEQAATVGTAVAQPLTVLLYDQYYNTVSGATIEFAVTEGGGSIVGTNATANENGIATLGAWTLGTTKGYNSVQVTSGGAFVTFDALGTSGAATQMAIYEGNNQSATVNTNVNTMAAVIVKDVYGNPVEGVTVTWGNVTGGGAVGDPVTTDANGIAYSWWAIGTTAGTNTMKATSTGLTGSPLTFTATGLAGAASQMAIVAGNNQTSTAGLAAPTQPSIKVTDAYGNPVANIGVYFYVSLGGGSVTQNEVSTNASGIATVGWTLAGLAGTNEVRVENPDLNGSPLTFTATGVVGAPALIGVIDGNGQAATVNTNVPSAPMVQVTDAFGNAVSGVAVTFAVGSGGGSITGGSQTSDENGYATLGSWKLGTTSGAQTLTVTSTAIAGVTTTITVTALADGPASMVLNAGNNQTATVGTAVTTAPSVVLKDTYGNPVEGAYVTFAIQSGGGGSIAGSFVITNAAGVAAVESWTLGGEAGSHTLRATYLNVPSINFDFTATATAGAAASVVASGGTNKFGGAGSAISTPPSVKVTDTYGNAKSGVSVTFAVASGGGSLTTGSATTNANGVATVGSWTLGAAIGANTMTATVSGLTAVTFTARNFATIAGGDIHTCATTTPGTAWCWGAGYNGQLGDGLKTGSATPVLVSGGLSFSSVVAGGNHSCGLTSAGVAYCWGNNYFGEIGNDSDQEAVAPAAVLGGHTFSMLAVGAEYTCGITTAGVAYCWGRNDSGQLGDASTDHRDVPVAVDGGLTFASISAGMSHTCGVTTAGAAYCWGYGNGGMLGTGTSASSLTPVSVTGSLTFASISAGVSHTCGVTTSGAGYCWGDKSQGRLGNGVNEFDIELSPVLVSGSLTWSRIVAGTNHTCGVTTTGVGYCWGLNNLGQLGDGSTTVRAVPTATSGSHVFQSIAAANMYSCGVTTSGAALCWGSDDNGQTGTGGQVGVPTVVKSP
jgi:adhesin/invasin